MALFDVLCERIAAETNDQPKPTSTVYLDHLRVAMELIEEKIDANFAELKALIPAE